MPVVDLGLRPGQVPVEIIPQGPVPGYPKMIRNELQYREVEKDWFFMGMVEYPSGRKKFFSVMFPDGPRDACMRVLMSEDFWDGFWNQFTTDMIKSGEIAPTGVVPKQIGVRTDDDTGEPT